MYDQAYGTQLALQHLIDLGHRQIAFIGGQQALLDGKTRHEAYLQTLEQNQLRAGPIVFGDFGSESGADAMRIILEGGQPFTAVFIASDEMALAALRILADAHIRVPEEVSIVGYNNDRFAPFLFPPLTSITNNLAVLGDVATEYLLELLQKPNMPRQQRVLVPELIVRSSSQPPARG